MENWHTLIAHPHHPPKLVETVSVALERQGDGRLWLRYVIAAPIDTLRLPEPTDPDRAENLWTTTCLELFVRAAGSDAYREYNFAPSGQWAAYRFSAWREGRCDLTIAPPAIDLDASSSSLGVEVVVAAEQNEGVALSLTAIVEEQDGTRSYWALAHPPEGPPNFHHPAGFVLSLP